MFFFQFWNLTLRLQNSLFPVVFLSEVSAERLSILRLEVATFERTQKVSVATVAVFLVSVGVELITNKQRLI